MQAVDSINFFKNLKIFKKIWIVSIFSSGMLSIIIFFFIFTLLSTSAFATEGDVFAKGTVYNAATYTDHPSHFGHTDDLNVVDLNIGSGSDDEGTPLLAPEDGTVTTKYNNTDGWGYAIEWSNNSGSEKLFLAHLKTITKTGSIKAGEKMGEIGGTGGWSPHLHIESNQGRLVLSGNEIIPGYVYNGPAYTSNGPLTSSVFVYDFWKRDDPIYASNQSGQNNFDAQFKVTNNQSSSLTINNMAIAVLKDGALLFDCWIKNSPTTIAANSSYGTGIQYCEIYNSGDYTLEARLDINGWGTYDTLSFSVQDQQTTFPDLVVVNPSVDDSTLSPGQDFQIFATVRNDGDATSDTTTLRYVLSPDSTIDTGDEDIGTDDVDSLGPSEEYPEDKSNRDAPSTPGTYWIGACVDSVSGETETGNNCSSGVQITVGDLTSTLSGKIREGSTTGPIIVGASITIDGKTDVSDSSGNYSISGISDGNHQLTVSKTGYETYSNNFFIDSDVIRDFYLFVASAPDLSITSISVSDYSLTPSQVYTVYATAENIGDADSSNSVIRYYLSYDSDISTSDTEMSTDAISGLAPDGTASRSNSATAPSTEDTYWIGACVDSVSGESNIDNNCSSGVQITVSNPTYPDLMVHSASVSDSTLTQGQGFTAYATVYNNGDAVSPGSTLRYYLSKDSTIDIGDDEISVDAVPNLSPDTHSPLHDSLVAPTNTGVYWIGACVDSVSGETETGNNCSNAVQITVENPTQPDLVVQSINLNDTTLTPDQYYTITATVLNQGDGPSATTDLRYYLSNDATISASDTELGVDGISSAYLTAGSSIQKSDTKTAPAVTGTYWIGACVDAVSGESNTGNNCSVGVQITVENCENEFKITASDGAASDQFGCSVAISGDYAIVGANDDDNGSNSGSAYIFYRSGTEWIQQAKLSASDVAAGDYFGSSVAISGDTAIIGASYNDDGGENSGSAYVFVKPSDGWSDMSQTAKLTASDANAYDYFGGSVSISGDTAIVGADIDDDGGASSGSAYVFVKPSGGWNDMTQTVKLTASDAEAGDYFGSSVAISGDTLIVGANGDDHGGFNSGSAYIFEKGDDWTNGSGNQTTKLTASDATAYDYFGGAVSISGHTAIVGAYGDDSWSGSAYVFVKPSSGWNNMTQTAKLTSSTVAADDKFGCSVTISGDTAIVGAHASDDGGNDSGAADVFVKPGGGWSSELNETAKLTACDIASFDWFGISVAINGVNVIIGAHGDDDASGSAYVYCLGEGAPEMDLKQGNTGIADGGSYDFGNKMVRTDTDSVFTIENTGTINLTLETPLTINGVDATEFSIQDHPASPVENGSTDTFTVRFNPASAGIKTATMSITNNDSDENPYELTLTGVGISPKGDLNGDNFVDLTDAIIALQVLTGDSPAQLRTDYASSGVDVNGDNRVGQEELIYILQKVAEIR